jgi:Ala-tRNA(Pro) deacylase
MKAKKVYDYLEMKEIPIYSKYEHRAVCTIDEANELDIQLDGADCKNLFLKAKKQKRYFLVSLPAYKKANLKALGEQLGVKRLSFATESELESFLGLTKGSVSPMGLINDLNNIVEYFMDKDLMESERISFHPNINTVTMTLGKEEFLRYIESLGRDVKWIDV